MNPIKSLLSALRGSFAKPLAGPESDPQRFFSALIAMPNPDTILRGMGQAEKVYFSIMQDAHVIGDVRSIRGSFRSQEFRLVAGNDGDSKSVAAKELCEQWMASRPPNTIADWLEVMWQMSSAIFSGYRAHEVVWGMEGGKYLPTEVIDRPSRRIVFNAGAEPLLISRENMTGAPFDPYRFVISRHMADSVNPYGVALMSSCFWPWTFKTGGWRYFVRYCERHGLPWPVGRYPVGTPEPEIDKFEQALANMLEGGYVVAAEGTGLELLESKSTGSMLPQQALIELANREMSKALTGQAMVAELNGVGSRAAAETAQARQNTINDSDRDISATGMGQILAWITRFNFGDGVAPPKVEFYSTENAGKDRAETYQLAADMGAKPSRAAMLEELGIPAAEDEADALQPKAQAPAAPKPPISNFSALRTLRQLPAFQFAREAGMTDDEAVRLATDAADRAIEDRMIGPVAARLDRYAADGKTLAEFAADLGDLVGEMDDEALREVLERALSYSILRGAATQAD